MQNCPCYAGGAAIERERGTEMWGKDKIVREF